MSYTSYTTRLCVACVACGRFISGAFQDTEDGPAHVGGCATQPTEGNAQRRQGGNVMAEGREPHKGFHAREGWYFQRTPNGGVAITFAPHDGDPKDDRSVILDASTWASAVASVSLRGENSATFHEALDLHEARG